MQAKGKPGDKMCKKPGQSRSQARELGLHLSKPIKIVGRYIRLSQEELWK